MLDYFLHPEAIPVFAQEKDLTENTIIVACAFGRNTWADDKVTTILAPIMFQIGYRRMDPDRFAMLQSMGFDAGVVNQTLAQACYQLANSRFGETPYSIAGQWEVMYELWRQNPDWYMKHDTPHLLRVIWPPANGEYLSTRGLFEMVRLRANENIAVVAQAIHMARCLRVAGQIFGQASVSKAPWAMPNLYDVHSIQPWTRSQESFIAQERKARVFEELPAFLRNIIRRLL